MKILSQQDLKHNSGPQNPVAGFTGLYSKSDNGLYLRDSVGQEQKVYATRLVRAATTGAITLSGTQTIDGVACVAGDRVLVHNQGVFSGNNYDNGIWVVAAGAWTRATDADTAAELAGVRVAVLEGSNFAGMIFETTFQSTDTLGTSAVRFASVRIEAGGVFDLPLSGGHGHMFYTDTQRYLNIWDGSAWSSPKGIQDYSTTAPSFPKTGELWYDSDDPGPAPSTPTPNVQVFTSSGTWNKPTGARTVTVELVGGGGGGGGAGAAGSGAHGKGGGGGAGGYAWEQFDAASLGSSETVTIGAAGTAGAAGANNGGTGGTTSFGSQCSADGGTGGLGNASSAVSFATNGGNGGAATGGTLNIPGAPGGYAYGATSLASGGVGASTRLGSGGKNGLAQSAAQSVAGGAATGYGSGGGGGVSTSTGAAAAGGAGAPGVVIVTTYF